MLLLIDDDKPQDPELDPPDTIDFIKPTPLDHHLSLNAMNGASGVGTIKFTGKISAISVQILVDRGSSDSFLQPRIAHCLKLPIEPADSSL